MSLSDELHESLSNKFMQKGIEIANELLGFTWGDGSWEKLDEKTKMAIMLGISSGVLATTSILEEL